MSDVTPRPGAGGAVIDPSAEENELLMRGATDQDIIGSGAFFDVTEDKYIFPKSIQTPASSIDLGTNINIHENGGFIETTTQTADNNFVLLEHENNPDTGSVKPIYFERAAKENNVVIQPDDSTQMFNVTSFNIGFPTFERQDQAITFNFINPVTNFAIRILVSGRPVAFYPNELAWLGQEPGENFGIGLQKMQWDPFFSNLSTYDVTVEMKADQDIDVFGDGTIPYIELDLNRITRRDMITEKDYPIESIGTSLISGGEVTANTTTTIDITAGKGRIVSIDNQGVPTITNVSWDAKINVPITNIATQAGTRITIDINGDVAELPVLSIPQTNRDFINLSVVAHSAGIVGRITNTGFKTEELYTQLADHLQTLGVTRRAGLNTNPNANLTFSKTAGVLEAVGAGVDNVERGQNTVSIVAENPTTFATILGITETVVAFLQNDIDPANYDSGAGTPTPIGTPTQQATIQYIYQSILQPEGIFVMYGQTVYPTLDDAVLNAANDSVVLPDVILGTSNLIGRIAVVSNATDLTDPLQAEFLVGVKFGTGSEGGTFGGGAGGGGDYFGPASSSVDEIHTFGDTSGKVGKSGSDVSAINGTLQRVATNTDLVLAPNGIGSIVVGDSHFKNGDVINYPIADGLLGDSLRTDGVGNLSLDADKYDIVTTDTTLDYDNTHTYIDASANTILLTLGDNPRTGEKKTFWMFDNTNQVTLESANPAFPISPAPEIAEDALQVAYTLFFDTNDRFTGNHDLTLNGTSGGFVSDVVNGTNVDVYNFTQSGRLIASTTNYKGIIGGSARSVTLWYGANAGAPTTAEALFGWGANVGRGRYEYRLDTDGLTAGITTVNRKWNQTVLNAANLFDGNMHHIAIIQTGNTTQTINLYIDGILINPTSTLRGTINTQSGVDLRLGDNILDVQPLNARMFDFRIFDRAINQEELDAIINTDFTGKVDVTPMPNGTTIDLTFNGSSWEFSSGYIESQIGLESRVEALENLPYVFEAERFVPTPDPIQDISFANQTSVYQITMTANTTFTFSEAKVGSGTVIELDGNFTPTFPTEWNELTNSLGYDGTLVNLVYVFCMDDTLGSEVFDFTILRRS